VLRIVFGTYFEAFMLAGLLSIAAALMALFIGPVAGAALPSRLLPRGPLSGRCRGRLR
jgi:hypothetical protein